MKKLLGIVMAGLLAVSAATAASAADGISVVINDKPVEFGDVAPQIIESRTMVPLRAIFEALNATVEWDDATKTVKSTKGDTTISLTIGENKLTKNGEDKELDVPAQIIESRTLVPVRAISEAFDCKVDWEDSTKTVKITSNPPYIKSDDIKGLSEEVLHEPSIALDGGHDGLDFYKVIVKNIVSKYLKDDGYCAVEVGYDIGREVAAIFKSQRFDAKIIRDMFEVERICLAKRSRL